jgi:hypothetical protein
VRLTWFILAVAELGVLTGCDNVNSGEEDGFEDRVEESAERVGVLAQAGFTRPCTPPTSGAA